MNLLRALTDLTEIFLACAPLYFLINWLDDKLAQFARGEYAERLQAWAQAKLQAAQEAEKRMWAERARKMGLEDKEKK